MKLTRTLCFSAALAVLVGPILAQDIPQEGPVPTTALISVESKSGAQLDPKALSVQVNGHDTPITSLSHAGSGPVEIGILIDDGLRTSFVQQIGEIGNFMNALPPNVKVLVGYMQNGSVRSRGHFSADHQEIADDLRITMSAPGSSASPYFCLSDFVKKWPSQERAARFVLMLTNGVDPYNGSTSAMNQSQNSPYVNSAQSDAQRAGVAVYSIYFPAAGARGDQASFGGQSYLQQVGDATGGVLFNSGTLPPVSIGPFLDQFGHAINGSYEVGFMANVGKQRNALTRVKVKSNQSGVKIHAPQWVLPGLTEVATGSGR
jgi:hypothetical protein